MKKIIILMTGLLMLTSYTFAQEHNYDIGKLAGAEFRIGLGARPAGMGEAFTALADDLNAPSWNAAGLTAITSTQVGLMHNVYLLDMSQEYLAYAQSLNEQSGIGINFLLVNYGTIEKVLEVDGLPEMSEEITPMSYMGNVGYGLKINSIISLGVGVKVLFQNIDSYSATAFAADLGAIIEPMKDLRLGLTIKNLGPEVGGFVLPMNAGLGAAYTLPFRISEKDKWQLVVDSELLFGDIDFSSVNIGTEYDYQDILKMRAGYKMDNKGGLGAIKGLSAGLGIKLNIFQLDYAFGSHGELGTNHQIGLSVML